MRYAKSRSGAGGSGTGVNGIASNYVAYQRWVRTTQERSKNDSGSSTWHKDVRPAEIQKSDPEVCETQNAICGFTNPLTLSDKDYLYCLSSGAHVPVENVNDSLTAEAQGKKAKENLINERLEKHEHFFEPVKRLN